MRHFLYLILLGAIWGASFLLIRVTSPVLGPALLMELRVSIAALILLAIVLLRKEAWPRLREWPLHLFLGLINTGLPFLLIAQSELHLTSGVASILNAMTPLFTITIMALMGRERVTGSKILGMMFAIVGVAALFGFNVFSVAPESRLSALSSLTAALLYAIGGVLTNRWVKTTATMTAFIQMLGSTVALLPVALLSLPSAAPSLEVIGYVIILATVSTAFAYLLFFSMLAAQGPTLTELVTFVVPVFGVVWGVLFLGEHFGWSEGLSMASILLAVLLVTGTLQKAIQKLTNSQSRSTPNGI